MERKHISTGNSDQFEIDAMVSKEIFNYIMEYSKKHKLKMSEAIREILSNYVKTYPLTDEEK